MKESITVKTDDYEAFIFDMDGLLLDTEKLCWQCFKRTCLEYRHEPDFGIYKQCIGRSADEGNDILRSGFGKHIPYDEINVKWNELYKNTLEKEEVPQKDGVSDFLKSLSNKKLRMAVATSTCIELALKKLNRSGILNYFEAIVCGDEVGKSKPDPEIYLKTAETLNVNPIKCIAFEDSENGVKAAVSAGMTVVQIPDLIEPSADLKKLGHHIVSSFRNIKLG